jgi:hypothetical protein
MGLAVRFYLFAEEGLQRISHRLMEGLAHGQDAMPQYAGTKQKAANVLVEMAGARQQGFDVPALSHRRLGWNGKMTASTRHPAEHAMRHEREGNKFPGFSPSRSVRLASCSVSKRRQWSRPDSSNPFETRAMVDVIKEKRKQQPWPAHSLHARANRSGARRTQRLLHHPDNDSRGQPAPR